MTKRIFSLLICIITIFSVASCAPAENTEGINVVCTIFPQYDFARNIVGNAGTVTLLVPPGKEAHSYEATVSDMAKLRRADLVVYIGGDIDGWVLSALEGTDIPALSLLDTVALLSGDCGEDEHEGHDHGEGFDQHIWTSPKNAVIMTEAIRDALMGIDGENSEKYTEACAAYTAKLQRLDAEFTACAENARKKMIVFAEKFPFRYLCEHYGIEHFAAFDGCATQSEPSLTVLAGLAAKIKENSLPAVLTVEFSTNTVASWLASETGAKVLCLHSCHSLTQEEFKRGESYISLMEKNLEVLREAMK